MAVSVIEPLAVFAIAVANVVEPVNALNLNATVPTASVVSPVESVESTTVIVVDQVTAAPQSPAADVNTTVLTPIVEKLGATYVCDTGNPLKSIVTVLS